MSCAGDVSEEHAASIFRTEESTQWEKLIPDIRNTEPEVECLTGLSEKTHFSGKQE
jgi:hypothetical protein